MVCVHPKPLEELQRVRDKLLSRGRFVSSSATDIAYTVLDAEVDKYQPALAILADRGVNLGKKLLGEKPPSEPVDHLEDELFDLKNHLANLRRMVIPQRDNMRALLNPPDELLIPQESRKYFEDVRSNLDRVVDTLETTREQLSGTLEAYTTRTTRRMNQQLTRLTALSTIFLPLACITGIYRMNFVDMPEIHYRYGYFAVLGVFVIIAISMVVFLRRKNMI